MRCTDKSCRRYVHSTYILPDWRDAGLNDLGQRVRSCEVTHPAWMQHGLQRGAGCMDPIVMRWWSMKRAWWASWLRERCPWV